MKPQPLALFDLDFTLLDADSEALWCRYLLDLGMVSPEFMAGIEAFYRDYENGTLDLPRYEQFLLAPLVSLPPVELTRLLEGYLPLITATARPGMMERVDWHRAKKHTLVLVTAANSFLAEPIAEMLGFPIVICTQVEKRDGCLTGNISGVPAFQHGKVIRLTTWLLRERRLSLAGSWFYSDSHNDLPLLKLVDHPILVEPDNVLRQYGLEHSWEILESCYQ